jgi:hypothetical protein
MPPRDRAPARSGGRSGPRRHARRESKPGFEPLPELSPAHPAFLLALGVAAACVLLSVSFLNSTPDLWQHLAVGRAIWELHRVPTTQLWTWPTYGAPDVNASWGFRALIWPLWKAWGAWGLSLWRWTTTLGAFALLWAAARRMGARGLSALVVMVLCALVYRQRSQIRPETLVAVLLALEQWILESWRNGRDRTIALVGISWVWANAHISYWLGLALMSFYVLEAIFRRRSWRKLVWVGLASVAISFVNPWGWRALWQPFEYFLLWRHEAIFTQIGELNPIRWRNNAVNGLLLLAPAWPLLMALRWRRRGLDLVELLAWLLFSAMAFPTQRFLGYWALLAAPFVARDAAEWAERVPVPAVLRGAWPRAMLTAAACALAVVPELSRPELPIGVGFDWKYFPVRACDFVEAHGIRGRGFNPFTAGGYMVYRFWPERDRLPFMDIHQAGTRRDRYLYTYAMQDSQAWHILDREYGFHYILMHRQDQINDRFAGFLDADSTWARVFLDDAGAVLVRRGGAFDSLARACAYRYVPVGAPELGPLGERCARDTVLRARVRAELEREAAGSRWNSRAKSLLANIALLDRRYDDCEKLLREARAVDGLASTVDLRLGLVALRRGRPREALGWFRRERRVGGETVDLLLNEAAAYLASGDRGRARERCKRVLARDPGNAAARASLAAIATRPGP